MATRGFTGRLHRERDPRLPPGQYDVGSDWPVLTAEATPRLDPDRWTMSLDGLVENPQTWSWEDLHLMPQSEYQGDIHCVTTWSKFDTRWSGVLIDDLLDDAGIDAPTAYLLAHSFDGYSTNVPLADLAQGKAMVALRYDGKPLERDHGGPARLLVPHLYFWKSAKWVKGLQFTTRDEAGFWELRGYHIYGDPWREQRYADD